MGSKQLARNTDPDTSHAAADELNRSGRGQLQKTVVFIALRKYEKKKSLLGHLRGAFYRYPEKAAPPTAAELAQWAGIDRYAVSRRLSDLERAGMVRKVHVDEELYRRPCRVGGRKSVVWETVCR